MHSGLNPILARVLHALAVNRRPGASFISDMLDATWHDDGGRASATLAPSSQYLDARGEIDPLVFGTFVDITIAHAIRTGFTYSGYMLTSNVHIRLTGAPRKGPITLRGGFEGVTQGSATPIASGRVEIEGAEGLVGWATALFAVIDGESHAVRFERDNAPPLQPSDLDAREAQIYALAGDALRRSAANGTAFISEFWGIVAKATDSGATSVITSGPHVANLLGILQGGLQIGIAQTTAEAALGPDWLTTSINACLLRAGSSAEFVTTSEMVHRGRTTAVLKTRLCDAAGKTVIEVGTTHARRK